MKSKINAKSVLLVIICFAAIFLLHNFIFSKNHPIIVQHYDETKKEYVFYKNVTKGKDIRTIHNMIQKAEWEKYAPAKDDHVLCQFYFDNGNEKAILYQVVNNDTGYILVQKDTAQKSALADKDSEFMVNVLQ